VDQQPDQVLWRGRLVGIADFASVERVLAAFLERLAAVVRGLNIPARPKPA
jgi:hypothetical protein